MAEITNDMSPAAAVLIPKAVKAILTKLPKIEKFNRYYDGDHPFIFASEKFTTLFANRLRTFRDNLCPTVVKAPADRLEVVGFSSDNKSALYNSTWAIWKNSQMPRFAKTIHRGAFKVGDAYAIVWADPNGKARIYPQEPENCTVFYDMETGQVESGAKVWRGNDNFVYITLYFADRIEKYISKTKLSAGTIPNKPANYMPRAIVGEKFPLPNPIGRPAMFHFGLENSILNDVIPINDALNKSIADMLISSESNSLRQRWASGIAFEINPETGKQIIPFETAAGWYVGDDKDAKFGQFSESNLKAYLEQINDFRLEIATVAGIPPYYLRMNGGAFPSGDALRKAESRFTALIADAQLDFGETWADIMNFALAVENQSVGTDAGSAIETRWKPADPMSANEAADLAIKKKTVGVSDEQNLSELGYSEADIKKMTEQKTADRASAADSFGKVFNAGPQVN